MVVHYEVAQAIAFNPHAPVYGELPHAEAA
jgi:hypothetical protein